MKTSENYYFLSIDPMRDNLIIDQLLREHETICNSTFSFKNKIGLLFA